MKRKRQSLPRSLSSMTITLIVVLIAWALSAGAQTLGQRTIGQANSNTGRLSFCGGSNSSGCVDVRTNGAGTILQTHIATNENVVFDHGVLSTSGRVSALNDALGAFEPLELTGSTTNLYGGNVNSIQVDGTNDSANTSMLLYFNGSLTRVKVGSCTVAAGTHNCLYFP